MVKISVIIKALNEEHNIERAIKSSLKAVAPYDGEVIVADSGSTDRTVERAMEFNIVVARLGVPGERCCGIAPQLGYQHSSGEYVYILDGDMELRPEFIPQALEILQREPTMAGVGGYVRETRIGNLEFEARVRRQHRRMQPHACDVDALSGGGLYRRAAIEQVGYLSDRNLHCFEEYDLGARLRRKGWRLIRLPDHAADHYSYPTKTLRLLWSRIRSGYILGLGELLRAAISGRYLRLALREHPALRVAMAVWCYWALFAVVLWTAAGRGPAVGWFVLAALLPPGAMSLRTRSVRLGFHSVLLWHVIAAGLLAGALRSRSSPRRPIESHLLRSVRRA